MSLIKHRWTKDEDAILKRAVLKYGRNWNHIKNIIPNRNAKQCKTRYINHLSPNINKNPFTKDEKKIIYEKHGLLGNKWSDINKFLKHRRPYQIRNYYCTHKIKKRPINNNPIKRKKKKVNSNKVRIKWSDFEDTRLKRYVRIFNNNWKKISLNVFRTPDECKERWLIINMMNHDPMTILATCALNY